MSLRYVLAFWQITFVHKDQKREDEEYDGVDNPSPLAKLIRNSLSIHLHGISFEVHKIGYPAIGTDGNVAMNHVLEKCFQIGDCTDFGLNLTHSGQLVQKDTVLVPVGGFTVIRWSTTSPLSHSHHCIVQISGG